MRKLDRGALGWGTGLLVLGLWMLARGAGIVPSDVAAWPVALAAAGAALGVHELLGERRDLLTPAALIAVGAAFVLGDLGALDEVPLLPAALVVAGAAILVSEVRRNRRHRRRRAAGHAEQVTVPLDGAREAEVRLEHGAGTVTLRGGARAEQLLEGTFEEGVRRDVDRDGDRLAVRLRPEQSPARRQPSRPLDWALLVSERVPVTLDLRTGAGRLRLDCSELTVPELDLSTGASDVELALPARGTTQVRVNAGAADVRVRVPDGLAVSVRNDTGLASVRIDESRFPRDGRAYESPGYADAEHRAEIRLRGAVGSFSVE